MQVTLFAYSSCRYRIFSVSESNFLKSNLVASIKIYLAAWRIVNVSSLHIFQVFVKKLAFLNKILFEYSEYFIISKLTRFKVFPFMQLNIFSYLLKYILKRTFLRALFLPLWFFLFVLNRFSYRLIFYFEVRYNLSFWVPSSIWKSSDASFINLMLYDFG